MCPDVEDMLFMYQDRYNSLTKSEAKIPVSQVSKESFQFLKMPINSHRKVIKK